MWFWRDMTCPASLIGTDGSLDSKSIKHESKIAHRKHRNIPVRQNRPGLSSAVMFCPECRAEYRPGFTRCSDCDIDLVSELSESDIAAEKLKRVWTGKDQARCAAICKGFREAGIPFKVTACAVIALPALSAVGGENRHRIAGKKSGSVQ